MGVEFLGGTKNLKLLVGSIGNAMAHPKYIVIVGATGSGKSSLALKIAKDFQGEIVNCDSVQLYKGFDIGAAKASKEEQNEVKHHLLDRVSFSEDFDAARYAVEARKIIKDIALRGKLPIVVGGSGLYLRSLVGENFHALPKDETLRLELEKLSTKELKEKLDVLDSKRSAELHINDRVRILRAVEICILLGKPVSEATKNMESKPDFSPALTILMDPSRAYLHERIALRSAKMLEDGFVSEVKKLMEEGCKAEHKPMQSIGYSQIASYLKGELPEDELCDRIIFATRQYAKRQCTWYKKTKVDITLEESKITEDLKESLLLLQDGKLQTTN